MLIPVQYRKAKETAKDDKEQDDDTAIKVKNKAGLIIVARTWRKVHPTYTSFLRCMQEKGESSEDKLGSEGDEEDEDDEDDDEATTAPSAASSSGGVAPTDEGFGVKKVRRGSSKKLETGLLNQIKGGGGETKSAKRS